MLNLPSHLWYVSGTAKELLRHSCATPSLLYSLHGIMSIDKFAGYLDVSFHVITISAILNEAIASGYGIRAQPYVPSALALLFRASPSRSHIVFCTLHSDYTRTC